MRGPIFIRISG